ncbi:hypothetical protein V6N13_004567 [Hibiscus sabdariffa]|uniref:ENT domain-containing protein n=1 Tax=Hibiscus sabdariffa TaxID=183260 RepID=A0ABR2RYW9_9ROSI
MKFRKGKLVEVLRREVDPCGSWFTADILSSHGDYYIIRYKLFTDREGKLVVEKVQGKDVRPLPPYVNGKNWAVGDVAEVFDVRCWRIGKVAKVLKNDGSFVIKLFGSIRLKEFHASSLRVRQAWHGNKWMVVDKVARSKELASNFTPRIPYRTGCLRFKTPLQHNGGADSVALYRSMRATRKIHGRRSEELSYQYAEIDEKFIKLSTQRNNTMEDTSPNCVCHSSRPVWSAENSDRCSVASCSFNGVADYGGRFSPKSSENTPDHSDAESLFLSSCGKKNLSLSPVNKVVDIHELELRAYKSTMEALYVSGPLTWEQQELLTNLRLSLNISDEEHLLQLRHLFSAHVL